MAMEIPAEVRRYWLPILLFTAGFLFQLLVLPRHFPRTHYDVLGIERFAPAERVVEAYERLSKEWLTETNHQPTVDIIKIRYAYELLTNPILKRDYDLFGLDEHMVTSLPSSMFMCTSIIESFFTFINPVQCFKGIAKASRRAQLALGCLVAFKTLLLFPFYLVGCP